MIAGKQIVTSSQVDASNNFGQDLEVVDYTFRIEELKLS